MRERRAGAQYGEAWDESWGVSSDDGVQTASYNSGMTTITTTQAIPTRPTTQLWRFVATFVAGVALASGAAVGIHAVEDHGTATRLPQAPVHVTAAIPGDTGCRIRVSGPC